MLRKARNQHTVHEERVQVEISRCVHFTGIQNKVCKAGVNIRELVGGPDMGWAARLPCLLMDADKCTTPCNKRHLPTREEAEVEVAKDEAQQKKMLKCLAAAHADAEAKGLKRGHGGVDSLPCPTECGGILRYSVAGVNGHMHARCDTPNCVSWME